MSNSADFSWTEVGARIRDRRLRLGMSQQALAAAAEITQNGVFRLEAGETNPQLSTLQQVAAALGCSVRELVAGSSKSSPALDDRFRRVRRIVEAGDNAALRVMDSGLEAAEELLERAGGQLTAPRLDRKIVMRGEARRSPAEDLLLMKGPHRNRSAVSQEVVEAVVRKASAPFRHSSATNETKDKKDKN